MRHNDTINDANAKLVNQSIKANDHHFSITTPINRAYRKTRTQDSGGPKRTQDPLGNRTLEDPGTLKTQDPGEPRTLDDPGPLKTQDPRGPRTLEDPEP